MTATPKLCFVIMPFSKERKEVFTYGIAPACKQAGFEAVRVDQLKGHFNINRKIIEHLFRSDVVIAEITDQNPNVFYEMGVAHSLGNKTIMIAQSAKDLPFDINNYRCLIYEQSVEGLQHLQAQIIESLQELEKWSQSPSNPVQDFKPEEAFITNAVAENLRRQLREAEQQLQEKEALLKTAITLSQWQMLQFEHQRALNDLKSKEQLLAQGAAQLVASQKEVERLRGLVPPAPKPVQTREPKLKLRAEPKDKLSEEEAKQMIVAHYFYDKTWNAGGNGVQHDYERVERNGAKLVVDHTTGLTWQQGGSDKTINYTKAEEFVRNLNQKRFAGYENWRLPTLEEAMSLMEREEKNGDLYIAPKFNKTQQWIWTADKTGAGRTWVVGFHGGGCGRYVFDDNGYVRAVR